MVFTNRSQAGQQLASVLRKYRGENPIIIGIPRGGLVVAAEVAKGLKAPLDIIIPRKIGAPYNPEVAIGAITQDGIILKDERVIRLLGIEDREIDKAAELVRNEICRREALYRNDRPALDLQDKVVIVVDDGIATGFTMQAALRSIVRYCPKKLVLAVPVTPSDTVGELRGLVNDLVCLHVSENFSSVGEFYEDFDQTTDQEVIDLLKNTHYLPVE